MILTEEDQKGAKVRPQRKKRGVEKTGSKGTGALGTGKKRGQTKGQNNGPTPSKRTSGPLIKKKACPIPLESHRGGHEGKG